MATKDRPSAGEELELASPFLDRELFVVEADQEAEPRAAALAEWSPFQGGLLPSREAGSDDVSEAESEEERADQDQEAEADSESLFEGLKGVTGEDDRQEVRETTSVPYKWICSVTYEKDGNTLDGGTGVLISNRHVLTAGHVITKAGDGPYAPTLAVYPGRHYKDQPFGRFQAVKRRVSRTRNLDFGLITLNKPVDPQMQWWGHPGTETDLWTEALLPLRQLQRAALPITTAGYPGVKDSYRRRMYEAQGNTQPDGFGANFRHTADTTEGQSGSPIWTVRGGRLMLIGIVTSYTETSQWGLLLHDGLVRRQVAQWMAEDAPRPRVVRRRIPLEVPYRWVCRLEVRDNDLKRTVGHGTGVMISNDHVLTSARVIHGFSRDRRRYSIRITPGYEFGKEALGSATASRGRVSPRFSPDAKDASEDYALLTMSRPLGAQVSSSIGKTALGSWGDDSHGFVKTEADWTDKAAHVAAFSRLSGGSAGYHKLRVATAAITGLQAGGLLHNASEKLDAPGAPIWVEAGKRRLLAGIATSLFSKESGANWGCYLSQTTQDQLTEWVKADHASQELPGGELEASEEEAGQPEFEGDSLTEEDEGDSHEEWDTLTNDDRETEDEEEAEPEDSEEERDEYGESEEPEELEEGEGLDETVIEEEPPRPAPKCSGPSATTGKWLTPLVVKDTTIPKYKDSGGTLRSTGCAIYVPDAALKAKTIDLLVFFHGDPGGCSATCFDPDPASARKFGLDAQIQASARAIALAVPRVYWNGNNVSQVKGKWSAANFNQFVGDVLSEIGSQTSVKRTLGRLIIAGHSRAYFILTPLALEFHQRAAATTTGHLDKLAEVWSFDSTYGERHVRALDAWASARPTGRFVAVHSKWETRLYYWKNYYKSWSFGFGPPPNLRNCVVDHGADTHCIIPTKYVESLLATTKSSPNWCQP